MLVRILFVNIVLSLFLVSYGSFLNVYAYKDIKYYNVCIDKKFCTNLAIQWWKWAYSFPKQNNPILDVDGRYCDVGQKGNVWMLAGSAETISYNRECTIPKDKVIFFPIFNSACSFIEFPNLKTKEDLINCAKSAQDKALDLKATLNNTELPHVRVAADVFNFTLPNESPLFPGTKSGTYLNAGDGEYVGIKLLQPGFYILKFSGTTAPLIDDPNPFSQDITYRIHVE